MANEKLLHSFYTQLKEIYHLQCIEQLLGWDKQVYMPIRGEYSRTAQLEITSRLIHQRYTAEEFLKVIDELSACDLKGDDLVNVREIKREADLKRKLPEQFVANKTQAFSEGYSAWISARKNNSFQEVLPYLQTNIHLALEEAHLLGFMETPYDALLDSFEPGSKLSIIKPALLELAEGLSKLLPEIKEKSLQRPCQIHPLSIEDQIKLNAQIMDDIGYKAEFGRVDATTHPFMTSIGPRDLRITTRYSSENYLSSLLTLLHEAGHALYEYGFDEKHCGTPRGMAVSLSIHESQSRFLENIMGRSRAFAGYLFETLSRSLPDLASKTSEDEIWNSLNQVESSLIRVEADEVTYSLHIVIRMLLEEELFNHRLSPAELPDAWNALYKKYLDIDVPDDSSGILQDVHWYNVGFGYFPTYALGNLYGALMLDKMQEERLNLDELILNRKFNDIIEWLRVNIHQHGMTYNGPEIAMRLSGKQLSHEPFLRYISQKHCV